MPKSLTQEPESEIANTNQITELTLGIVHTYI